MGYKDMTNAQAQGYAVIALRNILRGRGWHPADIRDYCKYLDREMYDVMDIIAKEEAEDKAKKILGA